MRLLYHASAHAPVRIAHGRAVWWSTGKTARAFPPVVDVNHNGIEVTLYERDGGTELSPRRAWFDRDGAFVCDDRG